MMRVVQCKVCPVCHGTRVRDFASRLPPSRREFECENCRGEGIVPLLTCRGCGRPAMHWDAKIPYCGRKDCWERLVEEIDPTKIRLRVSIPLGPRMSGFGGRREAVSVANIRNHQGMFWNPFREEFQEHPLPESMLAAERLTPEEAANFARACDGMCE
jgi:hypothetical protein